MRTSLPSHMKRKNGTDVEMVDSRFGQKKQKANERERERERLDYFV